MLFFRKYMTSSSWAPTVLLFLFFFGVRYAMLQSYGNRNSKFRPRPGWAHVNLVSPLFSTSLFYFLLCWMVRLQEYFGIQLPKVVVGI